MGNTPDPEQNSQETQVSGSQGFLGWLSHGWWQGVAAIVGLLALIGLIVQISQVDSGDNNPRHTSPIGAGTSPSEHPAEPSPSQVPTSNVPTQSKASSSPPRPRKLWHGRIVIDDTGKDLDAIPPKTPEYAKDADVTSDSTDAMRTDESGTISIYDGYDTPGFLECIESADAAGTTEAFPRPGDWVCIKTSTIIGVLKINEKDYRDVVDGEITIWTNPNEGSR